jgi:hypothetical protein
MCAISSWRSGLVSADVFWGLTLLRSLTVRLSAVDSNSSQSGRKRTPKVAATGLVLRRVGPHKLPIQVPKTYSAFHLRARRNAFRSHARQQSTLFALHDQLLRPNLSSIRFAEIVDNDSQALTFEFVYFFARFEVAQRVFVITLKRDASILFLA